MKGETIIVDVYNRGKENVTIHWHGVNMPRYPWTDGPEYITQCPIQPGSKFSQKIILSFEEGTLWWHAHRLATGADANASDSLLINGQPGDLLPCSKSAIVQYRGYYTPSSPPSLPHLPAYNDTNASIQVMASLRSLADAEHPCNPEVRVLEYNSTVEIVFKDKLDCGVTHPYISMDIVSMLLDGDLGILMKIRTLCAIIGGSSLEYHLFLGKVGLQSDSRHPTTVLWFMHCHVEQHLTWGMETAFIVKNGKHPEAQMLPPPSDMPPC
ncbi:hypothetical protein AAG906_019646 [Vitis piasezkii]